MVLKPEPLFEAVEKLADDRTRVILMTPVGRPFAQAIAHELAQRDQLLFICGSYEGVDERVRETLVDDELSIGDYVLTNGGLPAMVVIDAVTRLMPGVLGDDESARDESFSHGLLEYPHYTRPAEFRGMKVPEGDKERIQVFAGVVIGMRGRGLNSTFTVRRISYGEGVERVFPLHSPRVDKVEVERQGKVRRAKLTYLRKRLGKGATLVKEQESRGGATTTATESKARTAESKKKKEAVEVPATA